LHYVAVLNRDGGTLRTMDLEALCETARAIFTEHGHELDCRIVGGGAVTAALEAAARSGGIEVLLAAGGDGTISSAAAIAFATGVPLAVLPAGTMNLFARALGLPLNLNEALLAIAGGEIAAVDIATANDRAFVHQFGVGIHPRLVRIREGMTYGSRIGKMLASLRAIGVTVLRPPDFEADIHTGTRIEKRRASGIAISNNPLNEWRVPHADRLDTGRLGVYIAAPMSTSALLRLAMDVFLGNWRSSPQVSEAEVEAVTLQFPKRKRGAKAVIDGELITLERVVKLRVHPGGLKVILPRPETVVAIGEKTS